jgi:hypothetical protein
MRDERVAAMVKDVEARFPNIGDRARQAGETAIAGTVKPIGTRNGRTHYEVNYFGLRYTPSIEGGCQCPDSRGDAPMHNGKPLCFHRLAAMFVHRLAQEKIDRLAAIFTEAQAQGCADVRLRVRVGYTYDRDKAQTNVITGAIAAGDGRKWQTFEPDGEYAEVNAAHVTTEIPVTFAELHAALVKAGWRYETKNKAAGGYTTYGNEIWYFVPQTEHDARLGGQMATHIEAVAA